MKVATWNINSIRHRLPHLAGWLEEEKPDIVALQETKCPDESFPVSELLELGYRSEMHGQKGYNGVAVLCRLPRQPIQTSRGIPTLIDDRCRTMGVTVGEVRVISIYAVSGARVGSDHFDYKLRWFAALRDYLFNEIENYPDLVVAGDFNVAPTNQDRHFPARSADEILCTPAERLAYNEILALGLQDAFRLFPQSPSTYTWWRNGRMAFAQNNGLRLDHILITPSMAHRCRNCLVTTNPRRQWRPSDHAPVLAYFE